MTELVDYNIKIKVRNNHLLTAMRLNGIETASELARSANVCQQTVGNYLNLKKPPVKRNGEWSAPILKIADFLHYLPEDLFPIQHIKTSLKKNSIEVELSLDDIKYISNGDSEFSEEQRLLNEENGDLGDNLDDILVDLPTRVAKIIKKRYGLGGGEPMTLDQVAHDFAVTKERIRQIELTGLRMLRHPKRMDKIKEFV